MLFRFQSSSCDARRSIASQASVNQFRSLRGFRHDPRRASPPDSTSAQLSIRPAASIHRFNLQAVMGASKAATTVSAAHPSSSAAIPRRWRFHGGGTVRDEAIWRYSRAWQIPRHHDQPAKARMVETWGNPAKRTQSTTADGQAWAGITWKMGQIFGFSLQSV